MQARERVLSPIRASALLLACGLVLASGSHAAPIVVNSTVDDNTLGPNGNCTLREAIVAANTNAAVDACPAGDALPVVDEIQVPAGFYALSSLFSAGLSGAEYGDLDVTEDLEIIGAGADVTTIDATAISAAVGDNERVLTVRGDANLTIEGATLQGGRMLVGAGGAVAVGEVGPPPFGSLHLIDTTLRDNWALAGGALLIQEGGLTMDGSTVEGNLAAYFAGGLYLAGGASAVLTNSTFSGNSGGSGHGGAIVNGGDSAGPGDLTLLHVTITDNTAGQGSALASFVLPGLGSTTIQNSLIEGDCFHDVDGITLPPISLGGNVESPGDSCALVAASDQVDVTDPMIGLLQLNAGGRTATHALLAGSAAIDGITGRCLPVDQNDSTRPQGPACDSGAFEYDPPGGCQVASGAGAAGAAQGLFGALVLGAVIGPHRRRRPVA